MKTTTYTFSLYHFSEDEAMESISDLIDGLMELLPEADVEWDPAKSDYGVLSITVDEIKPF